MKFILLATAAAINNPVAPSQVALQHEATKTAPVAKPAEVKAAPKVAQQEVKKVLPKPAVVPPAPALHALGSKVLEDPPPAEKKEEAKPEAAEEAKPADPAADPAEDAKSLQDKVDAMRKEMCEKDPSKEGCEEFRTTTTKAPETTAAPAEETTTAAPTEAPVPESVPLPSQGFDGPPVEHNDMDTQTADWRREYGKDGPQPRPVSAAIAFAVLPLVALLL